MKKPIQASVAASLVFACSSASAITITATQTASTLVNALLSGVNTGIVVTSSSLSGHSDSVDFGGATALGIVTSSGTYTNPTGTYGIGPGVVLSTGGVTGVSLQGQSVIVGYGDGSNTNDSNGYAFGSFTSTPINGVPATASQEQRLDPITGDPATQTFYDHFDVTELVVNFDMAPGFSNVAFKIVFGSEEYPEFVDSPYIDGFGMFLNDVNIAQVAGKPVNIRHPDMSGTIPGTELDGILAPGGDPVLNFGGAVKPTGNTLRFIVADTSDGIYDTTVYFSALGGVPQVVPLPASVWLLGSALAGLFGPGFVKRRRRVACAG